MHQSKLFEFQSPITVEETKRPLHAVENPVPDEIIVRSEKAPMTESANPAYTANGSRQPISRHDEDNGWVVPMDQLTSAEQNYPEVENTKL